MAHPEDWEIIFQTGDQVKAEMVRGLLIATGFSVVMEARGLKALPAIFGHAAGGEVVLKVPLEQVPEERAVLEAPLESELDVDSD